MPSALWDTMEGYERYKQARVTYDNACAVLGYRHPAVELMRIGLYGDCNMVAGWNVLSSDGSRSLPSGPAYCGRTDRTMYMCSCKRAPGHTGPCISTYAAAACEDLRAAGWGRVR